MNNHKLLLSDLKNYAFKNEEVLAECIFLCRFYILVDFLQCRYWEGLEKIICKGLESPVDEAGEAGHATPLTPDLVLEVLRGTSCGSKLRKLVFEELKG